MAFEVLEPDGSIHHITVTKVKRDNVTIDIKHPFAGVALNFEVEVIGVREATKEKLDYGRTH